MGDDYASIRAERDLLQARLRETVGALETTRLGLLRLHAGSMTLEGLTTHVGLASDMTSHLGRMFAAQVEVNDLLRMPGSAQRIGIAQESVAAEQDSTPSLTAA